MELQIFRETAGNSELQQQGVEYETLRTNNGSENTRRKRKEVRMWRRRKLNSESWEKGDGIQNTKNERKDLESLQQGHGTQKTQNKVMLNNIWSTRESNLESQVHGDAAWNLKKKEKEIRMVRKWESNSTT